VGKNGEVMTVVGMQTILSTNPQHASTVHKQAGNRILVETIFTANMFKFKLCESRAQWLR